MKDLLTKYSSSLLMITHNLGIIAEICQNVAVMYAGRIVEYGSVEEIFSNPMHPYTKGLFGSIPRLDGARERLVSIPGTVANPEKLPPYCAFKDRCEACQDNCTDGQPAMRRVNEHHYVACRAVIGGEE